MAVYLTNHLSMKPRLGLWFFMPFVMVANGEQRQKANGGLL